MAKREASEKQAAAPVSAPAPVTADKTSLLDQIVTEGRVGRDATKREWGRGLVSEFVKQVLDGQMTVSPDLEAMINQRIAQIDHLLSLQLNEILHHPKFQQLESTWRGIRYLLENSETGVNLKIKVFNSTKKEILRDLQRVPEFDQSQMFKKVYEQEFGVFGGEPFAALLGDFEFGRHPEDIEFLERMSQVAAAAHAPFLAAAAPDLLNLETYTQLDAPRDLAKIFDTTEYARWKGFRMSEDSRYVCLTLPHVLMRVPYGAATKPVDGFHYEEGVTGDDHSKYLWGNAAFALGARITNAFARYGWCAAIRGGGRRPGGQPAEPYFYHRARRRGAQVPHRNHHHRPPREGIVRPGIRSAGALQGHRLRGVLQRPDLPEGQDLRHRTGQCERPAFRAVALHAGGFAFRALLEIDDAR
jgi:type VI secretion system protein ImpC